LVTCQIHSKGSLPVSDSIIEPNLEGIDKIEPLISEYYKYFLLFNIIIDRGGRRRKGFDKSHGIYGTQVFLGLGTKI